MFDGSSFKNFLYPSEKVVDTLIDTLKIDKESVDTKALVDSLNGKEECKMLNPKIKLEAYNNLLKHSPLSIQALTVDSLLLIFPKTYLKSVSTLRLDGIQIDLHFNKKDEAKNETPSSSSKSASSGALMKVINMFIRNIRLQISNIHIRIFIGKEAEYCLMLKQISFDSNEKTQIAEKEKMKFIFLHNKLITIKHILFKENNNEQDKLFFNSDDKDLANQTGVYINSDTLAINHHAIIIDFNHDFTNKELRVSNSMMPFYYECVVTKKQLAQMIKALGELNRLFSHLIKNVNSQSKANALDEEEKKEDNPPTPTSTPANKDIKKPLDLFGFPLNTIAYDLSMSSSYFALIDNLKEPKAKIWMTYENIFKSYYDLKDTSPTQSELIQKHLLYHNENFILAYLDNAKYSFQQDTIEKEAKSHGTIKSIDIKFIQPNQVKNKKDILIIKNAEANEMDKLFNENFFKHFFSVIKYGAYTYSITHIDKIDIKTIGKLISCAINQISFDFNPIIRSHLNHLYQVNQLLEINFEEGNRMKDINKSLPLILEISVTKFNIRLMTNKKSLKLYQKFFELCYKSSDTSGNKEKIYYNETYQQYINATISNVCFRNSSSNTSVTYSKLLCCYVNNNLIYPLLFQSNKDDHSLIEKSESEELTDNGTKVNVMNISSKVDEVLLFYNPLLSHKVLSYIKLLNYSIKMLTAFLQTEKLKSIESQYVREIRLRCIVKEIQLICVSSINLPKQKRDIIKVVDDSERLFKLLFNPMIKVKISNTNFLLTTDSKKYKLDLGINDIKLMIKKSENRFGKENASYQLVLEDQREEDNYEFITYNPSATRDCFKTKIEFDIAKEMNDLSDINSNDDLASFITLKLKSSSNVFSPIKGHLEVNDFVIAPLPLSLYEIVDSFDQTNHETVTLNALIDKALNYSSEVIEIASYEKFEPFSKPSNHKLSYTLTMNIQNLLIDLFSDSPNLNNESNEALDSNKNKMRLITQMTSLNLHLNNTSDSNTFFDIKAFPSVTIKLSQLNTIFMKNLDILSDSSLPLNGKIDSIADEGSFWRSIGFCSIFSSADILLDSSATSTNLFVNCINVLFCFDSFKFLTKFVSKVKSNIKKIQSLFDYIVDEDHESVITDINQYQNNNTHSYLEYRSINQIQSENNRNIQSVHNIKSDFIENNKPRQSRDVKLINNENAFQLNKQKKGKTIKISCLIYSINISFFQGEDFNFQGRYTSVHSSVKAIPITDASENEGIADINPHYLALPNENLQQPISHPPRPKEAIKAVKERNKSSIENINKRDCNNYITVSLVKTEAKCSYFDNSDVILSSYLAIQNCAIEDNLSNTRFKKLLSRFDFEDTQNLFLAIKVDVLSNSNGQNDLKAIIDLVPISIYLDQYTLKFLLDFFYYNQMDITSLSDRKDMNDLNNEDINEQILETQTASVSQINPMQYKKVTRLNRSVHGYSLRRLIINSFFVNFNYFPRKFNFFSTEEAANYELLNLVSIEALNITLKEVKILSLMPLEKLGAFLANYWKSDIKDNQLLRSILKAIPIMRNFNNVFSGFADMVNIPFRSLEKDISIEESLVSGVRSFVTSTSSELCKLGESVTGFFKRIGRVPETNDNGFRELLYKISRATKKRDQFYLKTQ